MQHERRQHEVERLIGEDSPQIAYVTLDDAGAACDALLR
jgi:hypothetical protein